MHCRLKGNAFYSSPMNSSPSGSPPVDLPGKLRHAMAEAGHKAPDLARLLGVKAPSVYSWLKTGRIAKGRIKQFAKLYGYPVSWWLDAEDDETMLTKKEKDLVEAFRSLPASDQEQLARYARLLANASGNTPGDTPGAETPASKG